MSSFLPDFNYQSVRARIDQKKVEKALELRQQTEKWLQCIREKVMEHVEKGYTNATHEFPPNVSEIIIESVVDELRARFPERLAFWSERDNKYILIHNGYAPIVKQYQIKFD